MGQTVNGRIPPAMGAEHYKTYQWTAPLETHWRRGTCEEIECTDFIHGFVVTVDVSNDLGARQYQYLTKIDKDRSPSIQKVEQFMFKFLYKPGTPCMNRGKHRVPIGRDPLFLVRGGDWRGNPRQTPTIIHRNAEEWVEDFAGHQQGLAEMIKRG